MVTEEARKHDGGDSICSIRPAAAEDADGIARLWRDMADQHRSYDAEAWDWRSDAASIWRGKLLESISDPEAVVLVAEDADGKLLGFLRGRVKDAAEIFESSRRGEVWDLVVDPDTRGKGIGRKLMVAGFDALKQRGAASVRLHVAVANADAVRFYRSLGMRKIMYRMYKKL